MATCKKAKDTRPSFLWKAMGRLSCSELFYCPVFDCLYGIQWSGNAWEHRVTSTSTEVDRVGRAPHQRNNLCMFLILNKSSKFSFHKCWTPSTWIASKNSLKTPRTPPTPQVELVSLMSQVRLPPPFTNCEQSKNWRWEGMWTLRTTSCEYLEVLSLVRFLT